MVLTPIVFYVNSVSAASLVVSTKTANYTIVSTDDVILADAAGGAITITLLSAVGVVKEFTVKRINAGSNNVSIGTTSLQTIDGGAAPAVLTTAWTSLTFVSNNANWFIK